MSLKAACPRLESGEQGRDAVAKGRFEGNQVDNGRAVWGKVEKVAWMHKHAATLS